MNLVVFLTARATSCDWTVSLLGHRIKITISYSYLRLTLRLTILFLVRLPYHDTGYSNHFLLGCPKYYH